MICRTACAVLTLLGLACPFGSDGPSQAQDTAPTAQKAKAAVEAYLKKLERRNHHLRDPLIYKGERSLKRVFPKKAFIVARYRQFPIPTPFPEELYATSVFAVTKEGKITLVSDVEREAFFKANAAPVNDQAAARAALVAWLLLATEMYQDGYYKFEILAKEFALERNERREGIRGRAIVRDGGRGEIRAKLVFQDGKLVSVQETNTLERGIRPTCQATKLLDPDPIVRQMAEQNLLFMGLAARGYLMEQRERARPQLREAIDRLWRRIQAEGW